MLRLNDVSYTYPETAAAAFSNVSMLVSESQLVLFDGESGCGKSSLLKMIFGIVPKLYGGKVTGEMTLSVPQEQIGYLTQCPEDQFICETVEEEAFLALDLAGFTLPEATSRWNSMVADFNMQALRSRQIQTLSGGEKKKVALVLAMIHQPKLLLLDEPLNQLDETERRRFVAFIVGVKNTLGLTVLVADHQQEYWQAHASQRYQFPNKGGSDVALVEKKYGDSENLVEVLDVDFHFSSRHILENFSATFSSHEIVAVRGKNGSGKSTLLKLISGQLHPQKGRIRVDKNARCAYLPQHPSDFFLAPTVLEEFMLAAKLKRISFDPLHAESCIESFGLGSLLNCNPHDLSVGQQQRTALAVILSTKPQLLLLDEPTHGMDAAAKRVLQNELIRVANRGASVVVATHDTSFVETLSDRSLWF